MRVVGKTLFGHDIVCSSDILGSTIEDLEVAKRIELISTA
jgi:hypothetical protein